MSGCCILDVGCGSGLYAAELAELGANVIGFDASAKLVKHARQRTGHRADLRVHDVRRPLDRLTDELVEDTWNAGWEVRFGRAPLTAWLPRLAPTGGGESS